MSHSIASITIRPAYGDDDASLVRLAELDSAERLPPMPILLAEVDGELRAALSLADGGAIADPFFPTAHLVALLRAHAKGASMEIRPAARRRAHRLRFA
jgi:hypothetical protein